jgi:trk system potassium uptake protein TrkH
MNPAGVLFLLGRLQLTLAVALLVPAVVAWSLEGDEGWAFLAAALVAALVGGGIQRAFHQPADFPFGRRDAFLLVAAAWVTASVIGALPYIFLKGPGFVVDGLFESASGFTTTGATILADVESEPQGLLLWRSLTHWLGGMGIIVLGIAVLPKLAVGGMDLLGAEAPGPMKEKLTPRIAQTAKALWGIYALLTAAEVAALLWAGMRPLEAVNHAFATMATGGFSTRNLGIGAYESPAIEIVVTVFMVLAGTNFALHFRLLCGRPRQVLGDPELRLYLLVLLAGTLAIAGDVWWTEHASGPLDALRLGAFQTASIMTTTGFATADFALWPAFSQSLLFLLMFVGGCAGSTGGSVKVVRVLIVLKKPVVDLKRLIQPNAVLPVRVGRRAIPDEVVASVTTFLLVFVTIFAIGGQLLTLLGLDLVSAYSASASCLGNIGPALGVLGPTETYAPLPDAAKLLLVALMIVGRLELYTVLVIPFLVRRML